MPIEYNIYCDESCHLEHDGQSCMVLGAVWCPKEKVQLVTDRIRDIKAEHNISKLLEIKWTKVSKGKIQFYLDLLNFFLDYQDLHFRALIVPDKSILAHESFKQTHDDWYYKMYFDLLKVIINPEHHYNVFIDYKDTQGGRKIAKLKEILENAKYDRSGEIISNFQLVKSHQVDLIQLTDLLTGIVSYANRNLASNEGKVTLVQQLRKRSRYDLTCTTFLREEKVNLLRWQPFERN